MSQTQTNLYNWEEHQPQPNRKNNYVYETQLNLKDIVIDETQPNQKALEWLRTQFYEKRWEAQENKEKIIQKAKNGEPIIVINYLNYSEHHIRTMVDEVLRKNDFGDDSSIFVVVPSVNDDAAKSSDGQNSTIFIQMSTNPLKWKNKVSEQAAQNSAAAHHGVKISSKGKQFFMEGLPAEILFSNNKKTSSDHKHLKDEAKKATKNKVCQINTPDGIVRRLDHSCNVITDTTADRPCCCSLKTTHYSEYRPNEKYIASAMSKLLPPVVAKHGLTGDKYHMKKKAQESVEPVTAPQAPYHIQPCRYPRAQHHRAQDQYHNNSAPQHDHPYLAPHPNKPFNDLHHARVPDQYHTHPTPQYFIPYVAPRPDKPCPDLKHATAPAQYYTNPTPQYFNPCFAPRPDKRYPDLKHATAPAQHYIHPTSQLVNPCLANSHHAKPCFDPHPGNTCPDSNPSNQWPQSQHAQLSSDPHPAKTSPDPNPSKPCPNTHLTKPRPDPHSAKPCAESNRVLPCPVQETTNLLQMQTCQCSPEMMLELLKLAVKGGKIEDMQSIGGEKRAESTEPPRQNPSKCTILAPYNEPEPPVCSAMKSKENDDRCPCGGRLAGMQIDMGETKHKQVSIKEQRYISTVGTSTGPKTPWYKPKWNKNICECPKVEPEPKPESEPEPKPEPKPEPEPEPQLEDLDLSYYFQQVESFEETMKKRSLETERVSGFRLYQKKKPPERDCTIEDAIRYYAMMHPAMFQRIMGEQQAKLGGKIIEEQTPAVTTVVKEAPAEEEGPFKGLKFKIGGKGSGTKGLAGICCFDLLQESFTTW